jgi:pimeloyl-ACP methyl ester carboxylesterase
MASTAVLVHGGFHGGWCWKKVRRILRDRGWTVFTPTLTGLGEGAHLASASVTLETHIQDVLGVLEAEELRDVVLCGRSAGGMVITAVADRAPERISHLIYLDAIVPRTASRRLMWSPTNTTMTSCSPWLRKRAKAGLRRRFLDGHASSLDGRPGWRVDRWDSGHGVIITEPERVADLISSPRNPYPAKTVLMRLGSPCLRCQS